MSDKPKTPFTPEQLKGLALVPGLSVTDAGDLEVKDADKASKHFINSIIEANRNLQDRNLQGPKRKDLEKGRDEALESLAVFAATCIISAGGKDTYGLVSGQIHPKDWGDSFAWASKHYAAALKKASETKIIDASIDDLAKACDDSNTEPVAVNDDIVVDKQGGFAWVRTKSGDWVKKFKPEGKTWGQAFKDLIAAFWGKTWAWIQCTVVVTGFAVCTCLFAVGCLFYPALKAVWTPIRWGINGVGKLFGKEESGDKLGDSVSDALATTGSSILSGTVNTLHKVS